MSASRTAQYVADYGENFAAGLGAMTGFAVAGRWLELLAAANSLHYGTHRLRQEAVADALDAGADWWAIGAALGLHPQAAFDQYGRLREGVPTPAQQRPHWSLILTAGLFDVHRPCPEYGVDLDDLASATGVDHEPTVNQLRTAASLLGQRAWIRVRGPNGRPAGDPIARLDIAARWTSVAGTGPELRRLREALAADATPAGS
jgi:hypothetical protein